MKLLVTILICIFSISAFAQTHSVESIRSMIRDRNIRTMEEFIEALPEDILSQYTLMHTSKSLHGATYEEPRAILYGKSAQWIITFNGSPSQAAGQMVEMMLYNPTERTYEFHELDFSSPSPVLHENPAKCLACHGSVPRPIWDHYNAWPGAYGDVDDRFNLEEYEYLTAFIKKAPSHPRYKHLKKLNESYKLASTNVRDGLTDRSMVSHNRDLNILLTQQKLKDLAFEMSTHPKYDQVKGLLFYFLSKCYMKPGIHYNGDGPILPTPKLTIENMLKNIKEGRSPDLSHPFQPEQFLDYVFGRLEVDTQSWYYNSRDLETYKILRDGSDRLHEAMLNYLVELTPEFKELYKFRDMDYQIRVIRHAELKNKNSCADLLQLAPEGIRTLGKPLPEVNTPDMTMRGERVCRGVFPRKCETIYRTLPQICLKCHTQTSDNGKIYLPFHEFPEMRQTRDLQLIEKTLHYIKSGRMPMRTGGDGKEFKQYMDNDFPKLKKYLEDLLK